MKIRDTLRGALRRVAGPSFLKLQWPLRRPPTALVASSAEPARRTVPLPSILTPGAPTLVRAGVMPKPTPVEFAAVRGDADCAQGDQHHQGPHRGHAVADSAAARAISTGNAGERRLCARWFHNAAQRG